MGRKSKSTKVINGKPNQGFIPLNPLGESRIGFSATRKMVMRLLGVFAGLLVFLFLLMAFGGGMTLHIYWSIIGPVLLSVAVFVAGIVLLIYLRGRAKTNWSRLGATCVMILLLAVVIAGAFTITYIGYTYGEIPVAYATSPLGQRVVIMRSAHPGIAPDALGMNTIQYTGYEMANSQFYIYPSTIENGAIYSEYELEPKWAIEWLDNDDARLYLPDYAGQAHSETRIITYDLSNMQKSLQEKGDLIFWTPAPPTTPSEPIGTKTPEASDPFAY